MLLLGLWACERFEFRGFVNGYEQANERFEASMDYNQIHGYDTLQLAQETYSVYVMGDSHLGTANNLKRFLDLASQNNAIAVLMAGDITEGHDYDYDTLDAALANYQHLNLYPVVGNHDIYFGSWKHFQSRFGSSSYLTVVETPSAKDLFIHLDSGSGTFGGKQLEWLDNLLSKYRSQFRLVSIQTHNNLFRVRHTGSTNPNVEEIYAFSELCVKHQVDLVITAHDHKQNSRRLGPTLHITMDALLDKAEKPGYSILSVGLNGLNHQFLALE